MRSRARKRRRRRSSSSTSACPTRAAWKSSAACAKRALKTLAARPGHVFTREALLDRVWGDDSASMDRTVDARAKRSFSLPRLGRRALGAFGAAYDEMRDALAGRNCVAHYVQTMTHEVKGPLSAIGGAAELLQESMADADRARFVVNIARQTQRIQEFVDR